AEMKPAVTVAWRLAVILCSIVSMGASASEALPQPPNAGTLRVTVVDPSSAVIVGATVTVSGTDDATRAATIAPVQTAGAGVAVLTGLTPGRYTIQAEFPGFEKRLLTDVRVRSGDNRQVAVLAIQRIE